MDYCSSRRKADDIRPEQKWDFISLNDFKSTSCWTPFGYGYLWIMLLISVAVYGVDTFTAVNLLAFDKWSSEVKPVISLDVSKWIFSACIIASWVNLGFEYLRAIRVIKRGAVAESYLDSLAVRLQCIRIGKKGRGWRRFLVFAELTKSKKGAEYVALFTYFSFQSWIRVIFCQGPRQVVNALTLYSVFRANLEPTEAKDVGSALGQFFKNIGILASKQHQQAAILGGMLFTLIIWIFAALSLILAILFYIFFLWHYIPNRDGGLTGYCERKINSRLSKIVSVKVNKAIEDEERRRIKADAKAIKKGEKPQFGRQATIPIVFADKSDGDKLPGMPMLNRNDTVSTLPMYSSRPGTPSSAVPTLPAFEMDQLSQTRPGPSRNFTGTSAYSSNSYGSNAPLVGNASDMGYGRSASPAPSLPSLDTANYPQRTMTNNTNFSRGPPRMPSAMGDRGYTQSPVSYSENNLPPLRSDTADPYARRPVGDYRSNTPLGPAPSMGRRTPFDQNQQGRSSPALASDYGRASPAPSQAPSNGGYQAYNPNTTSNLNPNPAQRSASTAPAQYQGQQQQYRNMTDPGGYSANNGDYFSNGPSGGIPSPRRAATGMGPRYGSDEGMGGGAGGGGPARLASPAPYVNQANGRSPGSPQQMGGYRR